MEDWILPEGHCPVCNGDGYIELGDVDGVARAKDCDDCNGSGKELK